MDGLSLSLLWDHAWMHRWINAFLSFAGWCAVRIKAHASQGKRWQKSWPTKSWGGGRRRTCPGRLAAFLPFPFSGDSLLNGPLLPLVLFWFKLLCLPCSLSPWSICQDIFGGCYNRKLAAVADTADGVSMVRLDNLFLLLLFLLNRWLSTAVYQKNRKHN